MTGISRATSRSISPVAVFNPLPWQVAPFRDKSPVILLTGSAGGGKSRVAAEKLHAFCLKYPGATALMMRKARESMTNSTVIFTERKVIAGANGVRHLDSKSRFEYPNGSILAYGGMYDDKQREQIRSIGQDGSVDIVWMEEANRFIEDDFNEVHARMRGKAAPWTQIILSCNPDAPTHWIYRRLILGGQARVYYSSAHDNHHNPVSYLDALDSISGVLGMRLRDGLWVQAEGAVYEDWDQAVHLIDRIPLPEGADPDSLDAAGVPKSWRRIRVVDFGFTNPFVCQWWAVDPDGRMYRYREIYMSQRTVRAHAEQIKALSEGEKIERTICDHDAEDAATLAENGIYTQRADKDISPGIQKITQRLRRAGDGRPRLFLRRGALVETDHRMEDARKPTCTEEEFPAYVWPKATDGSPVKEVPVAEDNHGVDSTRYAVQYVDATLRIATGPPRRLAVLATSHEPEVPSYRDRETAAERRRTPGEGAVRRTMIQRTGH